jgi:hypothetical protein
MLILGRSETVNGGNPRLLFFHQTSGVVSDLFSLSFQIFDVSTEAKQAAPLQVWPVAAGTKAVVAVGTDAPAGARVETGVYAPTWAVGAGEAVGAHLVRWFWKSLSSSVALTADQPFDVSALPVRFPGALYCLPSDMRAEGVLATGGAAVSDQRLQLGIYLASQFIERITGRYFEPRALSLTLDGRGSKSVLLRDPIIGLASIEFASSLSMLENLDPNANNYKVYNRHLRGLLNPDDRLNPRVELFGLEDYPLSMTLETLRFPRGTQNVRLHGVFGYTEADGTPFGGTPILLRHVAKMLTLRHLPKLTDGDGRRAARDDWRVTEEKTREQSISYALFVSKGSSVGAITGDPEIDSILLLHMRPLNLGSA